MQARRWASRAALLAAEPYLESGGGIAATGFWGYHDSTIYAQSLQFPNYNDWKIRFYGDCGWSMVSTEELADASPAKLYPNPAVNELTIEELAPGATLRICDPLGKTVKTIITSQDKTVIDVRGLPAGIYFIEILSGEKRSVQKFVKSN